MVKDSYNVNVLTQLAGEARSATATEWLVKETPAAGGARRRLHRVR